jgi:DNA-directed RNA polymerase subunit RPC12/RpoP
MKCTKCGSEYNGDMLGQSIGFTTENNQIVCTNCATFLHPKEKKQNKIGALLGTEGIPSGTDADGKSISEGYDCMCCGDIINGTPQWNENFPVKGPYCEKCYILAKDTEPRLKKWPKPKTNRLDHYFFRGTNK